MLHKLFREAQKEKWAIGHFNFCALSHFFGITKAAERLSAPVILATSENEANFLGYENAVALVKNIREKKGLSIFLHLDHARSFDSVKKAVEAGYDSVHIDGSHLLFEENLNLTKKVVSYAREQGVFVEGELGSIKGKSELSNKKKPKIVKNEMTEPEEVMAFVGKTGVDSLAIAVGSIHGVYSDGGSVDYEELDFERLESIRKKTTNFLVLHGGSGVAKKDLQKAIAIGIQKVNVNTELRMAWKKMLHLTLQDAKSAKPYRILPSVITEIEKIVSEYIRLFGAGNKAEVK